MPSLRQAAIRLAHSQPKGSKLRKDLLSLLASADFDPDEIGDLQDGAHESDADEPFMDDNFTQQEFDELSDKQVSGDLPTADKAASLRAAAIRLASAQPKGSKLRKDLLSLLASADFDPDEIGDLQDGAHESDADEPFMDDNFTQQEFDELSDKQVSGDLPTVDKAAGLSRDILRQVQSMAGRSWLIDDSVGSIMAIWTGPIKGGGPTGEDASYPHAEAGMDVLFDDVDYVLGGGDGDAKINYAEGADYTGQYGQQRKLVKWRSLEDIPKVLAKAESLLKQWTRNKGRRASEDSLRAATIRLAHSNKALRPHLLPLLQRTAMENILSPGQASEHPEVQGFLADLERAFRRHFPRGHFYARAEKKFGHNAIFVATATLPKGQQANGIIQNDPSYNTFWMHDSYTDEGLVPRIKIEMSQGNRLYGPNASSPQKVGWRNGTAAPSGIVRKFDKYFGKLAAMVAARDDLKMAATDFGRGDKVTLPDGSTGQITKINPALKGQSGMRYKVKGKWYEAKDLKTASDFDADQIGDVLPDGAIKQDSDEMYMSENFTGQEFDELSDKQVDGDLPSADDGEKKYAAEAELRAATIRLAHSNPALRPHLLPLLKQAKETTWMDVLDAFKKAQRAARALGPEAQAAVAAWGRLDEDHSDREFRSVQMMINSAVDPFYESDQDRMAEKLMRPWRIMLDFRRDRKLRSKGGKIIHVDVGDVKAVGITDRGEWFIDAIMRNTYRSPERWLYALVNEWQVPSRLGNKLYDQLKK